MDFRRISILGLGLVGGSLAKAIRLRKPGSIVTGMDTSNKHLDMALREGVIHKAATNPQEAVAHADIVFLCTPVGTIPQLIREISGNIRKGAVITDVGSTKQAIAEAGINPSDIGYINAHGTATNKGDTVETSSIKKVFGNTLPYVSSTKGATGHMMGAGGITETITCVKAIETGTVPPTINLNEVDPECAGIDFVANTAKKAEINFAMSNAFGFGGQNSSIIVGKYGK
mgnify:CR=1 FL=1